MVAKEQLALYGGPKVRSTKMPIRQALGEAEEAELMNAIRYYRNLGGDPGYAGHYEQLFCDEFSKFLGGGYTDAVSAGTAAIYVGLKALQLPPQSEIIISPVTDSGPLACIIEQGHIPVVADAAVNSYNIDVEQFLRRVTPRTKCLLAVHAAGEPLEIDKIVAAAHGRGIKVLEDCSQAVGAVWNGHYAGTVGDIAAFSTMYRKNLAAGASSGLLFTKDHDLFRLAQSYADRGKPVWRTDLDLRNPGYAFFPALNWNTDDLSCAIGLANLRRLAETNERRRAFLKALLPRLVANSKVCTPYAFHDGHAPFYFPIFVDTNKITCDKSTFAEAVMAEGIGLGVHYGCLVSTWPWAQEYLSDDFITTNAISTRDRCFHLYLNEKYGPSEVEDTLSAILKVESYFLKR